jgi:hypothetical protein
MLWAVVRPVLGSVAVALVVAGAAASTPRTKCPVGTGTAELAFVSDGQLLAVDMPGCNGRVLVPRGARPPVRWSADRQYVSFGGGVVATDGSRLYRGMSGVWAPRGHTLATITRRGGVVLGGPGRRPRRIVRDGFGAQSVAFHPGGRLLAVGRARSRGTRTASDRQIWIVDVHSDARRLVYRTPPGDVRTPVVAGWAPGGFVAFRARFFPAISINLDGVPLYVVPAGGGRARRVVQRTLHYDEFVTVCGRRLAVVSGFDRVTTRGKRLVVAAPPLWRTTDLSRDPARSWVSPACSPNGSAVAVSAGRNSTGPRFGLERRSIWVVSLDGRTRRRVTAPPPGRSDEVPGWSADGRALFFVRSGPTRDDATAAGRLYVVRLAGGPPEPVADLGTTVNYYGRDGWASQIHLLPTARGATWQDFVRITSNS